MKALVKDRREAGLWLREVPRPEPGPGEVLIRVLRTGICGSDLHIYDWNAWAPDLIHLPRVLGHELVGEIAALGAGVQGLATGVLATAEAHVVCGRCRGCRSGRPHLCRATSGLGVQRDGAFAEYAVVPTENVWRLDRSIDLDVAAIFDPFGNAVHTASQFPVVGRDVLVTGAGPIGIMAALVAQRLGARSVVVTDVNPFRLRLASAAGVAQAVGAAGDELAAVQARLGIDEGFEVGFEMSGSADAVRQQLDRLGSGGRLAVLGLPTREIAADWLQIVMKMLTVQGVYGREMFETWYAMSALVASGLDLRPVITHRFPFTAYDEAFAVARSGQCGKVVLDWTAA